MDALRTARRVVVVTLQRKKPQIQPTKGTGCTQRVKSLHHTQNFIVIHRRMYKKL